MLRWLAIGLAMAACESAPRSVVEDPAVATSARSAHGQVHVDAAADLQLAVSHGRLIDARGHASWLATHDMTVQPSWQPYVTELRDAARRIEQADDVATAGAGLGQLGHACGSCHVAAAATMTVAIRTAPPDTRTLAAQMQRYQWAAQRMWAGLSAPADRAWSDGANVIAATPADLVGEIHEKPNAEVFELAERLRDGAARAASLVDLDARAAAYSDMMTTCAGCHSILRTKPVSDTSKSLVTD